uniref:Uncharacterized protein n=1 Tax=Parascaris univalens TaxID=6257 RepID=A0A915AP71_PARUN
MEYVGFHRSANILSILIENSRKLSPVGQRFKRDPTTWRSDDMPFGMTHAHFIGTTMHQVELRPERAFANFVPMRPFTYSLSPLK